MYVTLLHDVWAELYGGLPPFCRSWPMKRPRQWWAVRRQFAVPRYRATEKCVGCDGCTTVDILHDILYVYIYYLWHFLYMAIIYIYIYILHVIYLWYIDVGMIISYLIHGNGVRNPVSEPVWVSVIGLYHFLRGIAHLLFVGVNACNTICFFPHHPSYCSFFLGKPMVKRMDTPILSKVHIVDTCHVLLLCKEMHQQLLHGYCSKLIPAS